MTVLITLQARLAEAEQARHQLVLGRRETSVSYEGKSVSFTQADMARLDAYIAGLKRRIADLSGVPRARGPVQIVF